MKNTGMEAAPIVLTGLKKAERFAQLIEDKKGENILILDVRGLCNFTDYFVLGSGQSKLQLAAIGAHIEFTLKQESNERPLSREGQKATNWVILDYGDVIAHVMTDETRQHYQLEHLWGDAPCIEWEQGGEANARAAIPQSQN